MADVFSKEKRSEIMSRVRSKGNRATEEKLASLFRANGFKGWRRNYRLFGSPDFVFPKRRLQCLLTVNFGTDILHLDRYLKQTPSFG